jgi:hypothetical protein
MRHVRHPQEKAEFEQCLMPKVRKLSELETRLAHIDQVIGRLSRLQDEANAIVEQWGEEDARQPGVPVLSVLNCEVYTKARTPLGHLKIVREKIADAGKQDESRIGSASMGWRHEQPHC